MKIVWKFLLKHLLFFIETIYLFDYFMYLKILNNIEYLQYR